MPADGKQEKIDENFKKVKRKVDRFKGMSEEEVMKKTLPDLLDYNLDYVIVRFSSLSWCKRVELAGLIAKNNCFFFQIGINPGLMAAYIGRWFPGPGNHFCKSYDLKYLFVFLVPVCLNLFI